ACNGTISLTGDLVTFDPSCENFTTAQINFTPGDLILFSNSLGSALQAVTAVGSQSLTFASGDPYHLNQRTDPQRTIQQMKNTGWNTIGNCYPATTGTRIWMISYYLDNVTDPAHARLIRRINFQTGSPVGETLENLQFFYNYKDSTTTPPTGQSGVPTGY